MTPARLRVAVSRRWHNARARLRGSAIVLTYHRIGDAEDDPHRLAVSAEHFAQQMAVVANEHPTLAAGELADRMRRGAAFPRRTVVVTLDDGYAETHATAAPILTRLGIHATSFLCSDTLGMPREYAWDAENASAGPDATARSSRRVLTADEVAAHQADGAFEFGAHTRTHPRLSQLDEPTQRDEIVSGAAALATILGDRPRIFAYPHGGDADFNETSVALAQEAGFDAAFTTRPGIVVPWADRFTVPRFHTEDIDGGAFRTLLNGWFDAAR